MRAPRFDKRRPGNRFQRIAAACLASWGDKSHPAMSKRHEPLRNISDATRSERFEHGGPIKASWMSRRPR